MLGEATCPRVFTAISGTFANLANGSALAVGRTKVKVSYTGGDGNDLTLGTVRPVGKSAPTWDNGNDLTLTTRQVELAEII